MILGILAIFLPIVALAVAYPVYCMLEQKKMEGKYKWAQFSRTPPSSSSCLEQDEGWAVVEGKGKMHFWLYKITPNRNNLQDATYFLQHDLPKWIEKLGYVIDYNHISIVKPNNELAQSIKSMITIRGYNMAVCAYQSDSGNFVVLDAYDKTKRIWWTGIIPIIG